MIPLLPSSRQDSILSTFSESHSAVGSLTLGNKAHDASVIFETMYVADSVGNAGSFQISGPRKYSFAHV